MRISWPRTHLWILPSSVASQVCKKFHNKSSFGIVHYKLSKLSKPIHLIHLNWLESIFIHYNIFWFFFALNIIFFLIFFSTYMCFAFLFHHGSCFLSWVLKNKVRYMSLFKNFLKKLFSTIHRLLQLLLFHMSWCKNLFYLFLNNRLLQLLFFHKFWCMNC